MGASLVQLRGKASACQCRGQGIDPWSRKIPHVLEQLSPWATTTEPVLQGLGITATEPTCPRARAPKREAPAMRSPRTPLAATRKKKALRATQIQHSQRGKKGYHTIFVFFCLTYFTQYDNRQVHPCCGKHHHIVFDSSHTISRTFPPTVHKLQFLHILFSASCFFVCFLRIAILMDKVVSHCGFVFLYLLVTQSSFSCVYWLFLYLWGNLCLSPSPILKCCCVSFGC